MLTVLSQNQDTQLFQDWSQSIEQPETRAAFHYLVGIGACLEDYDFKVQWKGIVRDCRFYDSSGRQPFSFITNKRWLLFYFRRPATDSGSYSRDRLAALFASFEENPSGEWTVKIQCAEDVEKLSHYLGWFQPLTTGPTNEPDRLADIQPQNEIDSDWDFEGVMFLRPGTGHQVPNRRRALAVTEQAIPGAKVIDKNTIQLPKWGTCHFSSFTAKRAAMVSSPKREDTSYGSRPWHQRDHVLLFRDARDGRCIIYFCDVKELLDGRAENRHGVLWDVVDRLAKDIVIIPSFEALKVMPKESK